MRYREFKKQVNELMPAVGQDLPSVGGAAIVATKALGKQIKQQVGNVPGAANATVNKTVVLPDKDTKRPGIYNIKSKLGNEFELEPAGMKQQPNKSKLAIKVNANDLKNTLNILEPPEKGSS